MESWVSAQCPGLFIAQHVQRVSGDEFVHARFVSVGPLEFISRMSSVFSSWQMIDILEGLRYLHTFPAPIAHGDLNPVRMSAFNTSAFTYTDIVVNG